MLRNSPDAFHATLCFNLFVQFFHFPSALFGHICKGRKSRNISMYWRMNEKWEAVLVHVRQRMQVASVGAKANEKYRRERQRNLRRSPAMSAMEVNLKFHDTCKAVNSRWNCTCETPLCDSVFALFECREECERNATYLWFPYSYHSLPPSKWESINNLRFCVTTTKFSHLNGFSAICWFGEFFHNSSCNAV